MSAQKNSATVRVHFASRQRGVTRTEYLQEQADKFRELCKTHDSVTISGYFYKTDIVRLYNILGYELPSHFEDMRDIPGGANSFFYAIVYNPNMNGTAK